MPISMTLADRDTEHSAGGGGTARARPRAARRPGAPELAAPGAQREQILAAAERLLNESGPDSVSAREVCAAAGIDRRVLASIFPRPGELQLALFDRIAARLGQAMQVAFRSQRAWIDAVRAALAELLACLDERPKTARFLFVSSLQGDPAVLQRREQALGALVRGLQSGCPRAKEQASSPFGGQAVLGAAASVLHGRLLEEPVPALSELIGPLMAVIVLPYLDAAAAREEVSRSLARAGRASSSRTAGRAGVDALLPDGMRLTSRTAQVLQTISRQPGMSNRAIAQGVGIGDEGQISRLLSRLRRLKLIEDYPSAVAIGTTKAWRLTPDGSRLLQELQSPGSATPDR
jgi:AcrR family transcriptional regulator